MGLGKMGQGHGFGLDLLNKIFEPKNKISNEIRNKILSFGSLIAACSVVRRIPFPTCCN